MYLGGSALQYVQSSGAGQMGVAGAVGPNNIGLLVTTFGTVSQPDSQSGAFFLNDGSGVSLKVSVETGGVPNANSFVSVTGISSCWSEGSGTNAQLQRLLRVANSSAITTTIQGSQAAEVSLDGQWSYLPATAMITSGSPPPINGTWSSIAIPGVWGDAGTHNYAWFGTTFNVPAADIGMEILLHFESVAFYGKVYVNGTYIADHMGDWAPFDLDATSAIVAGTNTLQVIVANSNPVIWQAQFPQTSAPYHFGKRHWVYSGFLGGPVTWSMGLPQSAWLKIYNKSYINSVFIQPHVGAGTLEADVQLTNAANSASSVQVYAQVMDGVTPVLSLPTVEVTIPAASTLTQTLQNQWTSGRLWWPDNPYLYNLCVYLEDSAGNILQTWTDSFGWREYTLSADNTYLNGQPFMLRGDSIIPIDETSTQAAADIGPVHTACNGNAMRFHLDPVPQPLHYYCDQAGIALLQQSSIDAGDATVTNATYWQNQENVWYAVREGPSESPFNSDLGCGQRGNFRSGWSIQHERAVCPVPRGHARSD